jgi:hypothetical protein
LVGFLFGSSGEIAARSVVIGRLKGIFYGVYSLPIGAPVIVDVIFEIEPVNHQRPNHININPGKEHQLCENSPWYSVLYFLAPVLPLFLIFLPMSGAGFFGLRQGGPMFTLYLLLVNLPFGIITALAARGDHRNEALGAAGREVWISCRG